MRGQNIRGGKIVAGPGISASNCRELWVAVIAEQFRLAMLTRPTFADTPLDIMHARNWFGCRDFHKICDLAGLGGDWVYSGYQRRAAELVAIA